MSASSSSAAGQAATSTLSAIARPSVNDPLTPDEVKREEEWKEDKEAAFEEGVELAFSRWEALNIAINNMAGPDVNDKVDQFITTAVDWFLEEKEQIHWDDVEGWLAEVLAEEFHIDAQDGSPEQIGRLLCTLYDDIFKKGDFKGLHRMVRTQSETARCLLEARRIGNAESDRHNKLMELEQEAESDFSEGDEDAEGEDGGAADGVAGLAVSSSSSSAAPAVIPEQEQKTAEQLQDEADGWETVPKKGKGRKGGK